MRTHRLWKPMVTLLIKNKQTWMTDWISCGIITPWKSWKRALSCTMELCSHFQDWNRAMQWHPTPVLLPGKSHGRRSLEGCSPWGHWVTSLSCIGEGNGNPLQCSCLEKPRDGGAWWAAVYGVAQSRTLLKRLSSGSSSMAERTQHCKAIILQLKINVKNSKKCHIDGIIWYTTFETGYFHLAWRPWDTPNYTVFIRFYCWFSIS